MNIAMWSGPRNLSTAMMYSFGARNDCTVWDEPFYAAYLAKTGKDHPMRLEILRAGEQDQQKVIDACRAPHTTLFYQKHMTQHMIPSFDRAWIHTLTNIFLIRDPARVIASYSAKRENPTLDDIGFRQQAELFEDICQKNGTAPPVIDSHAIRANPRDILQKLCARINLPFQETMLNWPSGGHKNRGVWAKHWYAAVDKSTGFSGLEGAIPDIPTDLQHVRIAAQPYYDRMSKFAIK